MNGLFGTTSFLVRRAFGHGPGCVGGCLSALFLGWCLSGFGMVATAAAAAGASGSPPLLGTSWSLVSLEGPVPSQGVQGTQGSQAVHGGEAAPQLHLEAEAPRVSGSTGCNRLIGNYVLDGGQLRITTTGTSRRACMAEGADTLERDFLAHLDQVRGWRIEGELLQLTNADGTPVLRLRATR